MAQCALQTLKQIYEQPCAIVNGMQKSFATYFTNSDSYPGCGSSQTCPSGYPHHSQSPSFFFQRLKLSWWFKLVIDWVVAWKLGIQTPVLGNWAQPLTISVLRVLYHSCPHNLTPPSSAGICEERNSVHCTCMNDENNKGFFFSLSSLPPLFLTNLLLPISTQLSPITWQLQTIHGGASSGISKSNLFNLLLRTLMKAEPSQLSLVCHQDPYTCKFFPASNIST